MLALLSSSLSISVSHSPLWLSLALPDVRLKLGDFGISRQTNNRSGLAQTMVGTPYYLRYVSPAPVLPNLH